MHLMYRLFFTCSLLFSLSVCSLFSQRTPGVTHEHVSHQRNTKRFVQEVPANSPKAILRQFRSKNSERRGGGEWISYKVLEPVCELRASEHLTDVYVPPPSSFLRSYGVTRNDCSSIQVTYNFPPEITGNRRTEFIEAFEFAVAIWKAKSALLYLFELRQISGHLILGF